jgi:hypothetical protein
MKSKFFAKVAMTAALAVAGSVTAFGWDGSHLQAKVNFPFKAFTADMPSGNYEVWIENNTGVPRFYLRNAESHKAIVLVPRGSDRLAKARPSMTFRCGESNCGLISIATGDTTYTTPAPKFSAVEKERLVTVYLDRVAGE